MKTFWHAVLITLAMWLAGVGCTHQDLGELTGKTTTDIQKTTLHLNTAKTELGAAKSDVAAMPDQPHKESALTHISGGLNAVNAAAGTNAVAEKTAIKADAEAARVKAAFEAYKNSEQRKLRVWGGLICGLAVAFFIANLIWLHIPKGWMYAAGAFAIGVGLIMTGQFVGWLIAVSPWLIWGIIAAAGAAIGLFGAMVWRNWDEGESLVKAVEDAKAKIVGGKPV